MSLLDISDPVKQFLVLLENPRVQAVLNKIIETKVNECLITSELRPIKRIAELETVTGLNDFADFEDEEREPSIPEQIKELSYRIEQPLNNSSREFIETTPVIETTLDQKTCAVVGYLRTEVRPNDFGAFVIGRKELDTFMQNIIEEGLRVKKVSRQLKADIFERAVKLFPDVVYIKRSKSGNKTKMLALKETPKCTITHTLTRNTPLGILV